MTSVLVTMIFGFAGTRRMNAVQTVVCVGKGGFYIWLTAKALNLKKY